MTPEQRALWLEEEWRPIPGWEGFYAVSDWGRVRHLVRRRRIQPGQILPGWIMQIGYRMVSLHDGLRKKQACVHALVALAFLGPVPPGKEVNHKDGNKLNNNLENLEYVTRSQNVQHAIANGLVPLGEANSRAKLTETQVKEIRSHYRPRNSKTGASAFARRFGVDRGTVRDVIEGRTWKHLS